MSQYIKTSFNLSPEFLNFFKQEIGVKISVFVLEFPVTVLQ